MNKMDEMVLAVARDYLFNNEDDIFQGLLIDQQKIMKLMGRMDATIEIRRGDAEDNDQFKQVIPYVIVRRGKEIFTYRRLEKGGEVRLHNQMSVGVGGHMNYVPGEDTWVSMMMTNALREINEELSIENLGEVNFELLGLINHDAGDAGLYHIGILLVMDVDKDAVVEVKETDQIEGRWFDIEELMIPEVFEELESWSQIAMAGVVRDARIKAYG